MSPSKITIRHETNPNQPSMVSNSEVEVENDSDSTKIRDKYATKLPKLSGKTERQTSDVDITWYVK